MSSAIAKTLRESDVSKEVMQGKATTDNPCTSCNNGCTCGDKCTCGKDCTCSVCPGQQGTLADQKGGTANAPGAGETREGQVSTT